jgi:plastocyanin
MIYSRLHFVLASVAIKSVGCLVLAEEPRVVHDPSMHVGGGLKKELIAGITEADFLRLGDKPKTVKVTLVTAFNETNFWMNLNGYSHGKAIYTVPVGWTVEVTFINPSPSPHSVVVVEREMLRKVQVGEPVFNGASIPSPVTGISAAKAVFTFLASEPGEYGMACGIPTHAASGHWVALNVSVTTKLPTLKLGDAPAKEAR